MRLASCPVCLAGPLTVHVAAPQDREYFVHRRSPASYLRCRACQCLIQYPLPDQNEANSFYSAEYQNYVRCGSPLIRNLFVSVTRKTAHAFAARFGAEADVLDFGCGQGLFLDSLRQIGMKNLAGYDVVQPENSIPGVQIFNSIAALKKSTRRYDVIRLNHVIEHLVAVDQVMRDLSLLLKPAGRIVGQTPNAEHYTSNLWRTYWGPLHFPYHLILFTENGLLKAASRWNLGLISAAPTIQPTGWSMSLENVFKSIVSSRRKGRSSFYGFFLICSLPLTLIDRILGRWLGTAVLDFELDVAGGKSV